jgi:predicted ester cyclase
VDVADDVFAPDYVRHDLRPTQAVPGPEGQKQIARAFREAFPDLRFDVEIVIAEGDYVAARWTAAGTHTGRWGNTEATGRFVSFSAVNIFRFERGLVAELWNHRDDLGLQEQLGATVFAGAPLDD